MANRAPEFFRQLNEQTLEALEEYARQPGRMGDAVQAWLAERGVTASRSAVYRWLQDFRMEDDSRRTAAMARAKLASIADGDAQAVSEAAMRLLDDRVLGVLAEGEVLSAKELLALSGTIQTGLRSRRELLDLREQVRGLEAKQKAAVAAAEKAEKTGNDPVAAIKKVLLGV